MALQAALDALITQGKEFQIKLREDNQIFGPGKVEKLMVAEQPIPGIYRILAPAMMQTSPNAQPQKMLLPVLFAAADVLVILEAPLNAEGEQAIMTPSGNGRSAAGLILPRS